MLYIYSDPDSTPNWLDRMPALVRRQNYRNVELYPETRGETIGVLLADGSCKFCRWLGFIDRDEAKRLPHARPVKLIVSRYSNESGLGGNWQDEIGRAHV